MIDEVAGGRSSLAIRFNDLRWEASGSAARRRLDARGPMAMYGEPIAARFRSAEQEAGEVIGALRWDLGRLAPTTEPFSEATIDTELWEHVRGLIEANDWEKVARESAVFVESKRRDWASLSAVPGSIEVFKQALASGSSLSAAPPARPRDGNSWLAASPGHFVIGLGIESRREVMPSAVASPRSFSTAACGIPDRP